VIIEKIYEKVKNFKIVEIRNKSAENLELVFFAEEQEKWSRALQEVLGEPHKPAGTHPSKEQQSMTEEFGGIYAEQTLFVQRLEEGNVIGMMWPWQDQTHITLKIFMIQEG